MADTLSLCSGSSREGSLKRSSEANADPYALGDAVSTTAFPRKITVSKDDQVPNDVRIVVQETMRENSTRFIQS